MKTNYNNRHSFSPDCVHLFVPNSWQQLDDKMKLWLFDRMDQQINDTQLLTLAFVKFANLRILEKQDNAWLCSLPLSLMKRKYVWLRTWQIKHAINVLNFITDPPKEVVYIQQLGKLIAVDKELHNVPFIQYITCENLYQAFIATKNKECLALMAKQLYTLNGEKPKNIHLSNAELFGVFFWWYSLKNVFAARFPHFFKRNTAQNSNAQPNMTAIMNAEIRALTGGDVTKEPFVFEFDTYRALTELNEKAREAKELNDKLNKK